MLIIMIISNNVTHWFTILFFKMVLLRTQRITVKCQLANEGCHKGIKKFDALHLACALHSKVDYFLTTDDGILRKSLVIEDIRVIDPIGFIKEVLA